MNSGDIFDIIQVCICLEFHLLSVASIIENVHVLTVLIHVHTVWLNDSRMPTKNCFFFEVRAVYIQ